MYRQQSYRPLPQALQQENKTVHLIGGKEAKALDAKRAIKQGTELVHYYLTSDLSYINNSETPYSFLYGVLFLLLILLLLTTLPVLLLFIYLFTSLILF